MKVVVAHSKTQRDAQAAVDKASGELFGMPGPIQIADQKKVWRGQIMDFSFVAKYGFISVPVNGTVTVDDHHITIESELPSLVKKFLGEDKVRAGVEKKLTGLLT